MSNINLSLFKDLDPISSYNKIYQDNMNQLNSPDKFNPDAASQTLQGYISKTQDDISGDQELVNDLQTLIGDGQKAKPVPGTPESVAKSFANVLNNYVNDVNNKQKDSEHAVETLAAGGNIDLHTVMIAAEKASTSMQLTMQLRNKIVQAYQEISRMQI